MRLAAFTSIYFLLACGLLMVTFRIDEEFRYFRTPRSIIVTSYVLLAVIMTVVCLWLAPLVDRLFKQETRVGSALLTGLFSFMCLCVIAVLFGPVGLDIPGAGVRGIFFSEWEFLKFILYDALPMSVVGALLHWWGKGITLISTR
jgi:hypothetical protein